ncbi:lysyl-tRNA synthetase, class 1 [Methanophagales archaeon]|nr:lysyl-tRNA synthetase, class 1 [Methanophagales archaeon]
MHWSKVIAKEIVDSRRETKQVIATGITPSGAIHVGNLREIIIGDAVHTALRDMDVDAKLIYIADTFDPLRRRYPFLPEDYETHVGKILTEIPDPEGCHLSYADHFLQPFLDSLELLEIEVEIYRADEMYKSGLYVDVIKEAFLRRDEIAQILEDVSGRQMSEDWTPFNPICDACGRITTAIVTDYDLEKEEAYYECECGNKDVASFTGGGKLTWRVDWAARWKILGVTIEPFGKDHAAPGGSFDTGTRISTEIYNYDAPYPIPFEHIHLKTQSGEGKKAKVTSMSSSKGTNIPVHAIVEAVPPTILKHVIVRVRPDKHIEFNPALPILYLIDEYEREIGGIGKGVAGEIPFRHLLALVQIARGEFPNLIEVIKRSGYAVHGDDAELEELRKKAGYAENWLRTYAPPSMKFELQLDVPTEELKQLSEPQRKALGGLAQDIQDGMNAEDWHNRIYDVASATNMETKELFQAIYMALLKKPSGPRAGWLLASLDSEFLRSRFESAAEITS